LGAENLSGNRRKNITVAIILGGIVESRQNDKQRGPRKGVSKGGKRRREESGREEKRERREDGRRKREDGRGKTEDGRGKREEERGKRKEERGNRK
jgi:hypothetical protein